MGGGSTCLVIMAFDLEEKTEPISLYQEDKQRGFAGGSGVKNPPAKAGDLGSTPDPGRPHVPRSSWGRAPRTAEPVLSGLGATTTESTSRSYRSPRALGPVLCRKRSQSREKPEHHSQRAAPTPTTREKPVRQQRPGTAKN